MPSKTMAQHNAMEAAAHGKSKVGIPRKAGKEFEKSDQGKKFSTNSMANALRKKKPAPQVEDEDIDGE
jgi:hypothetical protein